MRSAIYVGTTVAVLAGLGTFTASPALADESAYLQNLYSVGVPQSGTAIDAIYVKLGKLA